jgi:hypothetical protein
VTGEEMLQANEWRQGTGGVGAAANNGSIE